MRDSLRSWGEGIRPSGRDSLCDTAADNVDPLSCQQFGCALRLSVPAAFGPFGAAQRMRSLTGGICALTQAGSPTLGGAEAEGGSCLGRRTMATGPPGALVNGRSRPAARWTAFTGRGPVGEWDIASSTVVHSTLRGMTPTGTPGEAGRSCAWLIRRATSYG